MQTKSITTLFILILLSLLSFVSNSHAEWNLQDSYVEDNLYDVFFENENDGWAVGWGVSRGAVILETNDGGEFWMPQVQYAGTYLFSITFVDEDNGWAAGYNSATSSAMLMRTEDGGAEWTRELFRDTFGFYVVDFPSADVGYACGYGGSIYKTSDGGDDWNRLNTGTQLVFRTMHFVSEEVGIALAGTEYYNPSKVYRTEDGGESWDMIEDFGNSLVAASIHMFDENTGIIVGNDGREAIYRTTDGGDNWEIVYRTQSSAVIQALTFDGDSGIAAGGGGRIHITEDGGENWELEDVVDEMGDYIFATHLIGNDAYIVGQGGSIMKNQLPQNVDSDQIILLPNRSRLIGNFPNPFNSETVINYDLSLGSELSFQVYDLSGAMLIDRDLGFRRSGKHSLKFSGDKLSSGIYYYRIKSVGFEQTNRMILLK